MSRWKKLPEPLDQRVRQLVVQMRRLKDHSGLSLEALAARTAYSSSSWERYLNGKKLPPRQAVVELARIAETDPTRLLVLHELAEEAWGKPDAPAASDVVPGEAPDSAADSPVADPPPRRRRRAGVLIGAGGALVAVLAVVVAVTEPWSDGGSSHASGSAASTGPAATEAAPHYDCKVKRENGRLYAGNSRTSVAIIQLGMVGPEVAEAQCLLKHAGYELGAVDGRFGNMTERSVKRAQKKGDVVADGKVGPDTWPVLRR
ncbi:peptidoglycan-binding protein [Streptomyces sp. NPDC050610]|uniref:peptidoglycan-binding protein n=1 Tax=Streptomyces sp. NPDC050610 TaxID=3157097 RepID=UPI00341B5841